MRLNWRKQKNAAQPLPFDQEKHCGHWDHRAELKCRIPKGWRTLHPGKGRCKIHELWEPGFEGETKWIEQE